MGRRSHCQIVDFKSHKLVGGGCLHYFIQSILWTSLSSYKSTSTNKFVFYILITALIHLVSSLENMYKELASDIEGFHHPGHGDLTGWSKQGTFSKRACLQHKSAVRSTWCRLYLWTGVLLLNAVLTVRAHQANSHKDRGWETFTDAVVHWLSNNLEGLVFMLWGSYAQKKGAAIDRVSLHYFE